MSIWLGLAARYQAVSLAASSRGSLMGLSVRIDCGTTLALSAGTRFCATSCSAFSSSAAGTIRKAGRMFSTVFLSSPVCFAIAARAAPTLVTSSAAPVPARFLWVAWKRALPSAMAGLAVMMPQTTSLSSWAMELPYSPGSGEGVEIVVDQHLTGDGDDPAIGLHAVALFALAHCAALELAAFAHLQKLRRLAQLDPVHGLEVGGEHLAADERECAGIGVIYACRSVLLVTAARISGKSEVECRARVATFIAREAACGNTRVREALPRQLEKRHPAVLPGGVLECEERRAVAVQERVRDGVAAGGALVAAAEGHGNLSKGPVSSDRAATWSMIKRRDSSNVTPRAAQGLPQSHGEVQPPGEIVNRRDAVPLLRLARAGRDGFGVGGGQEGPRADRRAGCRSSVRLRARIAGWPASGAGTCAAGAAFVVSVMVVLLGQGIGGVLRGGVCHGVGPTCG